MKRAAKGAEPAALQAYRQAQPQASWEVMRGDVLYGGQQAYTDIRTQTHQDQGGLCAYCEIDIRQNDSLKSRIEHFHPKSDREAGVNWVLAWDNMLAVCAGGSYRHGTAPHTLEPLEENLSCDAHKDRWIQQKHLAEACEGWVLDPLRLPGWPESLFRLNKFNGELQANAEACQKFDPWPGNQHADMQALVTFTIKALNLNCERLRQARLVVIRDIERQKKQQRLSGVGPQQGLDNVAQRCLRQRWPSFVTTVCLCLGNAAWRHIQKQGWSF